MYEVVSNDKFEHDFDEHILSQIFYKVPYSYVVVYSEGDFVAFENVKRVKVMKTGCYVLSFFDSDRVVIIPQGHHRFITTEPMEV